MKLTKTIGYQIIQKWLTSKGYQPFKFQQETWQAILDNKSGLVNAPTGCGKTFSVFLGSIIQFINENANSYQTKKNNGLQLLWVMPLRALAKDIGRAMEEVFNELDMPWRVGIRNGDTMTSERQKQKRNMPEVLIITPESLHLLLAQNGYPEFFKSLRIIAVDEWHELLGGKRGVQVELALARIVNCKLSMVNKSPMVWGISATIGNLEEAKTVLLASLNMKEVNSSQPSATDYKKFATKNQQPSTRKSSSLIIKAKLNKRIEVHSIIPKEIEKYPWAGHLGIKLANEIIPIIEQSNTTLIFINTRGMSERWYQTLLDIAPQFAGAIALHHGSIEQQLRFWVEEALHSRKLKAVVCTASLDLGVDFRPVDTVIQVGSPKGVSRFLQRAGRSGHGPGEVSKIYFLPTHSLELVEVAALKKAIKEDMIESREPMLLCFDVLIQFLCTLAVGEGFRADEVFREIKSTYCFADITKAEWLEVLQYITTGGIALQHYDEYKKVELEDGLYKIKNKRIAMRHRMHIGTIVSDAILKVKFISGGYIGMIEEYFISRLEPGDVFTLAGRNVELVIIKDMTVFVRKSSSKKSIVPSWNGGRMSLTANLGKILRQTFDKVVEKKHTSIELKSLQPLFDLQRQLSHIPNSNELLIEHIEDKDGFHLLVYPFEGRLVHEAMSALMAYRIGRITPITFSIAMNDYGFELLSDKPIPVDDTNAKELFTTQNLIGEIQKSVNAAQMASRKFRDISVIGGLVFQGYPGEPQKSKHLQASASLLFRVFCEHDPNNLLVRQAYREVFDQQMEEVRLRSALMRIQQSKIIITFPEQLTPLSFPIIVDGLSRNNLSSEKLEDRVRRMQESLNKP